MNDSKPAGGALAAQNKGGNNNGKYSKKGKGSKCNNCGDPNAHHKPDDCFAINIEKRQAWEEKTGKTYIPYKNHKNNNGSNGGSAIGNLVPLALVSFQSNQRLADSGADGHVANSLAVFDAFTPDTRTIGTANPSKVLGTGTVKLRLLRSDDSTRNVTLADVTYVPKCPVNLFGARKLMKEKKEYILLGQLILRTTDGDEEICVLNETSL